VASIAPTAVQWLSGKSEVVSCLADRMTSTSNIKLRSWNQPELAALPPGKAWSSAITRVTPRLLIPWTCSPPGIQTSPSPRLRLYAYCMEIMASSQRQKTRSPPTSRRVASM
jgi:hypothetical protein